MPFAQAQLEELLGREQVVERAQVLPEDSRQGPGARSLAVPRATVCW